MLRAGYKPRGCPARLAAQVITTVQASLAIKL